MRISTGQIYQRGVDALLDQQNQLSKTQTQLGTGKRVVVPSDDPIASVQILELQKSIDNAKRFQDNISAARSTLNIEENAVGNAIDLLQRVRELTVQANSGVLDDQQRRGIAVEVDEHLASMMNIANTQDSNGDFIFAGFSSSARPFSQSSNNFNYAGDQGQRLLQVGPTRQVAISDNGTEVFQKIRNGNGTFASSYNSANTGTGIIDPGNVTNAAAWVRDTYTISFTAPTTYEVRDSANALVTSGTYQPDVAISFNGIQTGISGTPVTGDTFTIAPSANQDVFATLKSLSNALLRGAVSASDKAQVRNDVNRSMVDLDRALEKFTELRASIGSRLHALDNEQTSNEDLVSVSETTLAAVQDLDYPEAISLFNRQLVALQAAQQTFMKVQDLSLFNFLR